MLTVNANGAQIPALGFGVFRMSADELERVVPAAIEAGFRHFDTAQFYDNEAALGRAIRASGIPRDDLFLTTKVWVDRYDPERFAPSVDESLDRLGVDQVDLLLLHWPGREVPIADQIAMIGAVAEDGKTRHVGVSNYTIAQLEEAAAISRVPIVTDQVEYHPYIDQTRLKAAAERAGLALTGYFVMADGQVPKDPLLAEIGRAHGKSAAQVALRWAVQSGVIALSKTANPARVAENAAIFDFALEEAEMARIAGLARPDGRIVNPAAIAPDWD